MTNRDQLVKMCKAASELASTAEDGCSTTAYIECYAAISDLLRGMGMVFAFVTKDVDSKVHLLNKYHHDRGDTNAGTLLRMIEFEVRNNMTTTPKCRSASRTLLRLHRAMVFFRLFLEKIMAAGQLNVPASPYAHEAYKATMHDHHIWIVRKTVGVALTTIGSAQEILDRVRGDQPQDEAFEMLRKMCGDLAKTTNYVQALYEKHDLLALP